MHDATAAESGILEIGGKAIYELRPHPRKALWADAAAETRAAYRAQMQEVLNELKRHGFKVRR